MIQDVAGESIELLSPYPIVVFEDATYFDDDLEGGRSIEVSHCSAAFPVLNTDLQKDFGGIVGSR